MKKICESCGAEFLIEKDDEIFYEKMGVPSPRNCPDCRQQRRLASKNLRFLKYRKCDGTGQKILSPYDPDSTFPVFENNFWWSDKWDAKDFGRDFDFSENFFPQFEKLFQKVPKMALIQQGENENSKFCNGASWNKNCYLMFVSNHNEDCQYGFFVDRSKNCVDCFGVHKCEVAFDCIDCSSSYEIFHCYNLHNSNFAHFSINCRSCENVFACIGLRNKKYHILNQPVSKEIFDNILKNPAEQKKILQKFGEIYKTTPRMFSEILNSEDCSGCYILNSKNAQNCFDVRDVEDCKFCSNLRSAQNCFDTTLYGMTGANELLYECEGVGHGVFNILFSKLIWGGSSDIFYSYECFSCKNLFGCVGLKNQEFCILNKQFSREEYFELREKIILKMKQTGEFGEFFPVELSPFGYNETLAADYFPLLKAEVLAKNWKWSENQNQENSAPPKNLPKIADADQKICDEILTCEKSGKNYRINLAEFLFYKKHGIELPKLHPEMRLQKQFSQRLPRKLFPRNCANCGAAVQSPYSPKKPEKVFCEKCYLKNIE